MLECQAIRLTMGETASTGWAKDFRFNCREQYARAIEISQTLNFVSITQKDDHSFKGDFLWVVIPDVDTDFWLAAEATKEDAEALCCEMGWSVLKI